MLFLETRLKDVFIIEPERKEDERGFFARVFCVEEFGAHGLETNLVQCSISFSKQRGTLRGMHSQVAPYEEVKVVRCTRGAIYDVAVDLHVLVRRADVDPAPLLRLDRRLRRGYLRCARASPARPQAAARAVPLDLRQQHIFPAVGAMHVAGTQFGRKTITASVEQQQRMKAG